MSPLKPQYSLRWLFAQLTLAAIAVACFAYFFRNPDIYQPQHIFLPFFGFFLAGGTAVGGLAHRPAAGLLAGLAIAAGLWPFVLPALA